MDVRQWTKDNGRKTMDERQWTKDNGRKTMAGSAGLSFIVLHVLARSWRTTPSSAPHELLMESIVAKIAGNVYKTFREVIYVIFYPASARSQRTAARSATLPPVSSRSPLAIVLLGARQVWPLCAMNNRPATSSKNWLILAIILSYFISFSFGYNEIATGSGVSLRNRE